MYIHTFMSVINLSSQQLRKAADLKDKIGKLQNELAAILGGEAKSAAISAKIVAKAPPKKRKLSAAHKAKLIAGIRARWAKVKSAKSKTVVKAGVANPTVKPVQKPAKKKFVMSAEAKAVLSSKAKARWAKIKAAKQA